MKNSGCIEIVFDFDGVLVDTVDLLFSLHKEIFRISSFGEFQNIFRGNALENGKRTFGADALHLFSQRLCDVMADTCLSDAGCRYVALFNRHAIPMHIITSNMYAVVARCLQNTGMNESIFHTILGKEAHHSKVEKLMQISQKRKLPTRQIIFVTDSLGDLQEGRMAGVTCVGVTWGIHDREILSVGKPHSIVHSWDELYNFIIERLD